MGRLPDLDQLFVVGDEVPKAAVSFRELLCDGRIESSTTRVDPDAVCILLYTSGTTSAPKGVQLTHNNILAEYQGPLYMTNGPFLSCFPAGHIAGLNFLLRPLICGVSSVYLDRWDPALAAELIVRHSLRESGGVPYFLTSLLQAAKSAGHSLTTLEAFSLGGSSVTPEHVRMTDQNRCPGGRIYGLTEHSTVTYCDSGFSFEQRAFTDGRVARGNEVQIVDDAGIVLPVGEQGEITTRGPEMFVGYTDDALNEECFLPGGWFRTGDIGRCSKDNFLTVTDRKKDIIIRGGENISSKEVEDALIRHPAVLEAAAVAMPDDTMGERVCAFVIAQPQATLSLEEVRQHFQRLGIAKQKTPEKLQLVTELPRTPSGKIRKVELRSQLRSHTNRNFGPNV